MDNKDFSDYIRDIEYINENLDKAEAYAKSIYFLEAIRNNIDAQGNNSDTWKNDLEIIAVDEMRKAITNLINTLKTGLKLLLKE